MPDRPQTASGSELDRVARAGETVRAHLAVFAALAAGVGVFLGDHYIASMPYHDGYFLVGVEDAIHAPRSARPQRTAFILVDGLRADAAETMESARVLARSGQCRVSDQGPYTISRPEYALLSTGLEVDRSGLRSNNVTTPAPAESVWQIARQSGLRVAGSSHLGWIAQLFPEGFDRFSVGRSHATDVFAQAELVDVNVFHPLYVDEAGHQYGAASPEYRGAVARADREIASLLARLDLGRDLVVLTADHGHRDRGGHGGAQPEIKDVLVCFAGFGVERAADPDERRAFDGRSTGPLLALLLGLRFPRHMRAGDDGLDVLWEIAAESPADAAYFADRRAALERFRDENRVALERWLGGAPGTWPRLHAREARRQSLRAGAVALAGAIFVALRLRRRGRDRSARTVAWLAANLAALWGIHHLVLGDFDYSVINRRELFVVRALGITAAAATSCVALHWTAIGGRRITPLVDDVATMVALYVLAMVGHVVVYGWALGYPVPPAPVRYFPVLGAIVLFGYAALLGVLVAAEGALGALRNTARGRSPRSPDR